MDPPFGEVRGHARGLVDRGQIREREVMRVVAIDRVTDDTIIADPQRERDVPAPARVVEFDRQPQRPLREQDDVEHGGDVVGDTAPQRRVNDAAGDECPPDRLPGGSSSSTGGGVAGKMSTPAMRASSVSSGALNESPGAGCQEPGLEPTRPKDGKALADVSGDVHMVRRVCGHRCDDIPGPNVCRVRDRGIDHQRVVDIVVTDTHPTRFPPEMVNAPATETRRPCSTW